MNFELLKEALASKLSELGVTEYEIYYMSDSETSVATLNKEVSSFSSGSNGGLCLRVLVDGKMGYASTELMTESEMKDVAVRARDNALATEKPDTVGIYHGSDSYDEFKLARVEPMTAGELRESAVSTAEKLYAKSDKVKDGSETQALSYVSSMRLFNSHGLDLSLECGLNALIAAAVVNSDGESQSDYSFKNLDSRNADKIADEAVCESVDEALAKIGASLVPTGKYNVVISGKQMGSLLSVFSSAFSAKTVLDGMSKLKGMEGERIAADIVNITDDPQREGNTVGTYFDAEGVATHRKSVVKDGVLLTFLHNRETALAMGRETTANASKGGYSAPIAVRPYSFAIEAGDKTRDELFALAGDGIFITELKGLHAGANPVSGDFSLESAGYMIRDGKKAEPVKSFTMAGNFFDLLKEISALGDKIELGVNPGFTSFPSPDVLLNGMSIAGK